MSNHSKIITVGDLKKALEEFSDNTKVVIPIHVPTKAYSVCQPSISFINHTYGGCALNVWVNDNQHIVTRKTK